MSAQQVRDDECASRNDMIITEKNERTWRLALTAVSVQTHVDADGDVR